MTESRSYRFEGSRQGRADSGVQLKVVHYVSRWGEAFQRESRSRLCQVRTRCRARATDLGSHQAPGYYSGPFRKESLRMMWTGCPSLAQQLPRTRADGRDLLFDERLFQTDPNPIPGFREPVLSPSECLPRCTAFNCTPTGGRPSRKALIIAKNRGFLERPQHAGARKAIFNPISSLVLDSVQLVRIFLIGDLASGPKTGPLATSLTRRTPFTLASRVGTGLARGMNTRF